MGEEQSEWKRGVEKGLSDGGLSGDNNVGLGMAGAMRSGVPEAELTYAEGYATGKEVARRCKYHKR